jgi:hypothetical protein
MASATRTSSGLEDGRLADRTVPLEPVVHLGEARS